jgi:hypothetical protein
MAENELMEQVQNQASDAIEPHPETEQPEKVLKQSEVNRLIGEYKKKAYQKGRMDQLTEMQGNQQQPMDGQQPIQQPQQPMQPPVPQQSGLGGMPGRQYDDRDRQFVQQVTQEAQRNAAGQAMAAQFHQKIDAGKAKYPDFEEKAGPLMARIHNMPYIAAMATAVDNTADVIYDLGSNLHKVANLKSLHDADPELAFADMMRLSQTIRSNQQAASIPAVSEPLSQIKPSTAGMDNGDLTIEELRNQPWMRA